MTQLLGLSFDAQASPSIRLVGIERHELSPGEAYGWGLAWYPSDGEAAMVVKDPTSAGRNALTALLSGWERFASSVFVGHLRGAAKRRLLQDTHPFRRSFGGRDWVLAHNGDLRHGFRDALPLPVDPVFEPLGRTDSEHVLCWLLAQVREAGARRLRDVPIATLTGWLRQVNRLGTLNLILSDGADLVAYSDAWGYKPLWWLRHVPPTPQPTVTTEELELALGDAADESRTAVIVSSQAFHEGGWQRLDPGTAIVVRRGAVVGTSDPLPLGFLGHPVLSGRDQRALRAGDPSAALRLSGALAGAAGLWPGADMEPPLPLPDPPVHQPPPSSGAAQLRTDEALRGVAEALRAPELLLAGLAREEHGPDGDAPRVLETWHETTYVYANPVELSSHLFRLRPVHDTTQELLDHRLHVEPEAPCRTYEDVFGNATTEMQLRQPYTRLRVVAQSRVRLHGPTQPRLRAAANQARLPLVWMPWQRQMMLPYLLPPELPETQLRELSDWAASFVARQDGDLVETLKDLNETIYRDFGYVPSSTRLATTPYDVYANRQGVCQDFANLLICVARLLSIPARYRVGYIFTGGQYSANTRQGDASHAWVEVYLPSVGWRGLDPTNGTLVGLDHVRVAAGRNYVDATPTGGTLYRGGGGETLAVNVRVLEVTDASSSTRFALGDP